MISIPILGAICALRALNKCLRWRSIFPQKAIALQLGAPLGSPVPGNGTTSRRVRFALSMLPTMVRGTLGLPGRASPT